jgi:hypothetical protein
MTIARRQKMLPGPNEGNSHGGLNSPAAQASRTMNSPAKGIAQDME